MNADVEAFVEAIRSHPKVSAAMLADPIDVECVNIVECMLRAIYAEGNTNGQAIEIFDTVRELVTQKDASLKERLSDMMEYLDDKLPIIQKWGCRL